MDAADGSVKESVMIALLPITSDWCKQELPHMTLVYAGLISDLDPTDFNEIAKDAASIAMLSSPLTIKVTGVDTFGDDAEKVDVLRLDPTQELLAMRRTVERWNASEHDFKPHCTIGPIGSSVALQQQGEIPRFIAFDRVYVGWGETGLPFMMNRSSRY